MTDFAFSAPEHQPSLSPAANLVYSVGLLASQAVTVTRTLCAHPDKRAENDAEHSFMLALIAVPLAEQYFPALDSGLVAKYAVVHDITEVYVGDTPTHDISDEGLKDKAELEARGRQQLRLEYQQVAPSLVALVDCYEEQRDAESRFVRMLDKLVTISIQFPDNFATIREHYERASHKAMVDGRVDRFKHDYADQQAVLELYDELARFMQEQAWPNDERSQ